MILPTPQTIRQIKHIKTMKESFFTVATLLLISLMSTAYGQVEQAAYTELEVDRKAGTDYQTLLTGDKGVLCFLESKESQKGGKRPLRLYFYDQNLHLKWEQAYSIDYAEEILYEAYEDGTAYFLTQQKEDEYRILSIDIKEGMLRAVKLSPIKGYLVTRFMVYNEQAITGGEVNDHPLVLLHSLSKDTPPTVLPSISQLDAELLDIVIDSTFSNFYVVMDKTKPLSEQAIYLNRYDMQGNLELNTVVPFSNEYNMLSYQALPTKDEHTLMIYGTYGLGNDTGTQGVYNFKLEDGKLVNNRFYDFSYLKNFFNYLNDRQKKRKLRRIQRQFDNGKRMRHRYKCFVHPLQIQEDRIILTLETYNATADYRRSNWSPGTGYGSWSDPSLRRYMNTLGYYGFMPMSFVQNRWTDRANFPTNFEYKHAVTLSFNKRGQLLWDNSFIFNDDTESSFPIEKAQVAVWNDTSLVVQTGEDEENLFFKISYESQFQEERDTLALPLPYVGDKYRTSEYGGVLYWYNKSFISSGLRKIRNTGDRDMNRHVFYLAKFSYTGVRPEETAAEDQVEK